MRLVVIVPFLNEELLLPIFLGSVDAQHRKPDELVLVDDGSSDDSSRIAVAYRRSRPWVTYLRRERPPGDQRDRLVDAAELRAFLETVEALLSGESPAYDVIAKVDADLRLTPRAFEDILRQFVIRPDLGMVGTFLAETGRDGRVRRIDIPSSHVHGATKFYRRECLASITPLPALIGWDIFDEVMAREQGWATRSIAVSDGDPLHLRPRGAHDGILRGHRRSGLGAWTSGHDPIHEVVYALREMSESPLVLRGLNHLIGYVWGALRRAPRVDVTIRVATRRDQRRRMSNRARTALLMRPRRRR